MHKDILKKTTRSVRLLKILLDTLDELIEYRSFFSLEVIMRNVDFLKNDFAFYIKKFPKQRKVIILNRIKQQIPGNAETSEDPNLFGQSGIFLE